ncbi:MAG TPA: hypothetical protein VMR97_07835 [Acidimicrobiales bacterium]|nr:hypothetical protein [Acidimicrobiales bacterium]
MDTRRADPGDVALELADELSQLREVELLRVLKRCEHDTLVDVARALDSWRGSPFPTSPAPALSVVS